MKRAKKNANVPLWNAGTTKPFIYICSLYLLFILPKRSRMPSKSNAREKRMV